MDIVHKVFSLKRHLQSHQANGRFYRAIVPCCAVALLMISSTTHADEASMSYSVHPIGHDDRNPLSGVFATRAPVRPNLVGLSLCKVISVNENVIEIDGIDAFAGTPVLDLKPYIPSLESIPDARTPQRY